MTPQIVLIGGTVPFQAIYQLGFDPRVNRQRSVAAVEGGEDISGDGQARPWAAVEDA